MTFCSKSGIPINGIVIGVDNDEFLGDFANVSLYNQYLKFFKVSEEDRIDKNIKYMYDNFILRPYIDKLFEYLKKIKLTYPDKIKIVMITSCKNTQGWVTMLHLCLEKIYDCSGLYDTVIYGEMLPIDYLNKRSKKEKNYILSHPSINCPEWNFVMLDDVPQAVIADKIISISAFKMMSPLMKYIIEIPGVREYFKKKSKLESMNLKKNINHGYEAHKLLECREKGAGDEEMLKVVSELGDYISSILN